MDSKKAQMTNFVTGSNGKPIIPPGNEKTVDPIKMLENLHGNMESIQLNLK
jgi:hypothetical protein